MLSFISERRVLAASAAGITAAIFLFLLGTFPSWRMAIAPDASWPTKSEPERHGTTVPDALKAPTVETKAPVLTANAPSSPPAVASAPANLTAQPTPGDERPAFDIVRVEPSGDSVIAARARPGVAVVLLDQGKIIARATADGSGQVAFVPPALPPGEHSLMLSIGEPGDPGALSSQSVAVSVPERAKSPPMVALLQPDQPTRLLSREPQAAGVVPPVSIGAIDVEEAGSVFATGRATPGSRSRVYLNGSFVAEVPAGQDGSWSLKIQRGMRPGHYSVRVDELASANGEVRARAEVPFDYPARGSTMSLLRPSKKTATPSAPAAPVGPTDGLASTSARTATSPAGDTADKKMPAETSAQTAASIGPGAGPATSGVPTVVAQLLTTKVTHGDTLWRISRKMLGHGRRYTQIYQANATQIRDPRLIYPGQIFVMPQRVQGPG